MKPHKGKINLWRKMPWIDNEYYIAGIFEGHPKFDGTLGHTSLVMKQVGNEIETLNSRYTLGEPLPENMKWM